MPTSLPASIASLTTPQTQWFSVKYAAAEINTDQKSTYLSFSWKKLLISLVNDFVTNYLKRYFSFLMISIFFVVVVVIVIILTNYFYHQHFFKTI